jgi:methionyl-tRNA formyltransferase
MSESPISLVFCGTSEFAVPILERLADNAAFRIDLVITQPDRPAGRKQELTPPPVKVAAEKLGLKIAQPEKLNAEIGALSATLKPDYLVVASYGQLLSDAVLAWPKIKPVNVHPSLLPRWRGATPLNHTILGGDREGGTTIQVMAKEMDAGPILAQEKVMIDPRETYQSLHDRLAELSAPLLEKVLLSEPEPKPQPESGITICKKLSREDGVCDSQTMTAEEIDRKVRGLNPWPGVTMDVQGVNLKILETDVSPHPKAIPVNCTEGTLYLVTVQEAGKKPLSGADWARGKKL